MNALRKVWPAYLTAFVCALCVAIGFTLGSMKTTDMARESISELRASVNAAILRRYGQ